MEAQIVAVVSEFLDIAFVPEVVAEYAVKKHAQFHVIYTQDHVQQHHVRDYHWQSFTLYSELFDWKSLAVDRDITYGDLVHIRRYDDRKKNCTDEQYVYNTHMPMLVWNGNFFCFYT